MKRLAAGAAAVALIGVATWLIQARTSESPTANPGVGTIHDTQSAAGMRVYRDPVTGELLSSPPAGTTEPGVPKDLADQLSTSSEGLVARPAPGGGVMVDLQGRFQHTATVTTDADGQRVISCDTGVTASSATAEVGEE
jgi:hypothetical protein